MGWLAGASGVSETQGDRYDLVGARVYLHVTVQDGERILHLDVDHPDVNRFLLPRESTYVGGKEGGFYVGLRPQQAERAEAFIKTHPGKS